MKAKQSIGLKCFLQHQGQGRVLKTVWSIIVSLGVRCAFRGNRVSSVTRLRYQKITELSECSSKRQSQIRKSEQKSDGRAKLDRQRSIHLPSEIKSKKIMLLGEVKR